MPGQAVTPSPLRGGGTYARRGYSGFCSQSSNRCGTAPDSHRTSPSIMPCPVGQAPCRPYIVGSYDKTTMSWARCQPSTALVSALVIESSGIRKRQAAQAFVRRLPPGPAGFSWAVRTATAGARQILTPCSPVQQRGVATCKRTVRGLGLPAATTDVSRASVT